MWPGCCWSGECTVLIREGGVVLEEFLLLREPELEAQVSSRQLVEHCGAAVAGLGLVHREVQLLVRGPTPVGFPRTVRRLLTSPPPPAPGCCRRCWSSGWWRGGWGAGGR